MNSDPISEATPKRRKTETGYHPVPDQTWDNDSENDDLFNDIEAETIATLPLTASQRGPPAPSYNRITSQINSISSPRHITQPTQPLGTPHAHISRKIPSSPPPSIQVARSSPAPPSPSSKLPLKSRPIAQNGRTSLLASVMAPAGTAFRLPPGVQPKPAPIEVSSDDDPQVDHSSDEDTQPMRSRMQPTQFKKGGRGLDSSPNRVQESPNPVESFKSLTSKFTYSSPQPHPQRRGVDDMADAYGGRSRKPKPSVSRQHGPARAMPVQAEMGIDDITDLDVKRNVERMQPVVGKRPIRELVAALHKARGNYLDALDIVLGSSNNAEDTLFNNLLGRGKSKVIDLESSDIESGVNKLAAKPIAKQPPKPTAKQEVRKPTQAIHEKYYTQTRGLGSKPAISSQPDPPKRKRLVQGRKTAGSPVVSPSPEESKFVAPVARPVKKAIVIESDSEEEEEAAAVSTDEEEVQVESTEFNQRLLKFLNECSVEDLADISAQPQDVANLIVSERPFRNLDAVRQVSNAPPTKTGRKTTRKPIGEKVVDVCEEMLTGYEAVDALVEKCEDLGRPVAETMKKWGLDLQAASKDGELTLTSLDEAHDSGVGTPSSSVGPPDDDDFKLMQKSRPGKGTFLKQPSIMSSEFTMKDYQLVGLNWLNLLWSRKLSCILADDMGLGKTCQVISFLAHLRETDVEGPHLVVVPGSTLENWLREFNRFCPDLVVSPYYGSQKDREGIRQDIEERRNDIDVIVTTYETAANNRLDTEFLRKTVRPTVCVFDEGHVLKNSKSNRHKQLMRIPAKFRLLLTGTPLQNNLQELVSLLSFIMPKLFQERQEDLEYVFKHKASTKDADHSALLSAQRIGRARSMMTPFILRRKKQQVLKHMPAKHCRVEYCDMVRSQQEFYEEQIAVAMQARLQQQETGRKIKAASSTGTLMALRFAALHPLLSRRIYTDAKLKKIQTAMMKEYEWSSNRPDQVWKYLTEDLKGGDYALHVFCSQRDYLMKYALKNEEWMDSGKVNKLRELLERYVANGEKVLIFSQFTTMMDILEAVFETLSIKFMRLDGSTEMATRQDIIDQFSTDATIPVFMLSTKAGGAGINLACANKVIIFDSSFNPQEDIQAENRAHRVGQTREVEVVRLVTRGTIEEQIHALGESKLALDSRVAGGDASELKQAEKDGEQMVEKMLFEQLDKKAKGRDVSPSAPQGGVDEGDLKGQYRKKLRDAGLDVKDDR